MLIIIVYTHRSGKCLLHEWDCANLCVPVYMNGIGAIGIFGTHNYNVSARGWQYCANLGVPVYSCHAAPLNNNYYSDINN